MRRDPVFTQSLWSWNRESDGISRALIYGLKGCSREQKWRGFARLLLAGATPGPDQCCLVPIPSKSGKPDHAAGFASALAKLTGFPVLSALRVVKTVEHQKTKSREQRRLIQFAKARPLKNANPILVDDVVTSGATLQAAYKALGKPVSARALCFIDRGLVADYDEACYKNHQ